MDHPSPRTPGCLLLFVIALLILIVLRSGVLAVPDFAHTSKDVGANATQTPDVGRSNVTIRNNYGAGHGGGNGYGGGNPYGGGNGYGAGNGYGGGNGYSTPMPQGRNPMTVKGAADHGRGLFAAGYRVLLLGATVSWMLLFVFN